MEGFDGCVLDDPHYPPGLSIGPGVIRPGLTVFDAVDCTAGPNDMADEAAFGSLVVLDELVVVIGQHRVDPIRYSLYKSLWNGRALFAPGDFSYLDWSVFSAGKTANAWETH